MEQKAPFKKPYTIILDTLEREEVVRFARNNTWNAALAKYNISIATLKRWSAIFNHPTKTLERKYGHKKRKDKYQIQCMHFSRFLYDHSHNTNVHGFLTWTKAQVIKQARKHTWPRVNISTMYRLFQYVSDHQDEFEQYL